MSNADPRTQSAWIPGSMIHLGVTCGEQAKK